MTPFSAASSKRRSRACGLTTVWRRGGGPALDLLLSPRGEQYLLTVLDLMMPSIDGIEVLTKLRAANRDLPVIVLTATGGIDTVVQAMHAGRHRLSS